MSISFGVIPVPSSSCDKSGAVGPEVVTGARGYEAVLGWTDGGAGVSSWYACFFVWLWMNNLETLSAFDISTDSKSSRNYNQSLREQQVLF